MTIRDPTWTHFILDGEKVDLDCGAARKLTTPSRRSRRPDRQCATWLSETLAHIIGPATGIDDAGVQMQAGHARTRWLRMPRFVPPSPGSAHFIVARTLFGTFAATLNLGSTSSVMSYFNVEAKRIATSLSLRL